MKLRLRCGAALAVALLATGTAAAQIDIQVQPPGPPGGIKGPPGFGMNPEIMLLGAKDVQKELKLTEEQIKKVAEITAKQAEILKGALGNPEAMKKLQEFVADSQKLVKDALKPEQLKRLQQLELQQRGPAAFFDPRAHKELKLTAEQIMGMQKAMMESFKKLPELFKEAKGDPKAMQKAMAQIQKGAVETMVGSLTPEQKTKWQELVGEPFKGELPAFGPGMFPPTPGVGPQPPPPIPPPPVRPDIRKLRPRPGEPPGIFPTPPPIVPPPIL